MKKLSLMMTVAALFALPLVTEAQTAPQSSIVVEKAPGAGAVRESVEMKGKIKSINKKERSVVVIGPDGEEIPMILGEQVRNFDQIKAGDIVTLTMTKAFAIELSKIAAGEGYRERVESENTVLAKPGDKPGMSVERSVRVMANVVAINPQAQTVTLRGPRQTVELALKDPGILNELKVGDKVEAVYSEAVALTLSAAPKK